MKRAILIVVILTSIAAGWDRLNQVDIQPGENLPVKEVHIEFKGKFPGHLYFSDYGNYYVVLVPTNSIKRIEVEFVKGE